MKIPKVILRMLNWFDEYPYRISVVYLCCLALAFVPLCLRVGNFMQSQWNPFPTFSDHQVLLLGYVCDKLFLLAALVGVAMFVVPFLSLAFGRLKTAAKMFVGLVLALLLTAVVLFCMGPLIYVSACESESIRIQEENRDRTD